MKSKPLTFIKDHLFEILETKTTPHSIASGFAIGTFISILPLPGFNILIATALVLMFKRISKIAIFVAMAIWNPITLIPVYYSSYQLGILIFKNRPTEEFNLSILNRVYYFTNDFIIGNIILSFVIALISFYITFDIVKFYREKKTGIKNHHH